MFDFLTPASWFWLFLAIMMSCYVKLQASNIQSAPKMYTPASITSLFDF